MSERFLCVNKDSNGVFSISLDHGFAGNRDNNGVIYLTPHSDEEESVVMYYILEADKLRAIGRFFTWAADECDPRAKPGPSADEIRDEIDEKNKQLETLQQQFDALTAEISKLRIKHYDMVTKKFVDKGK